MFPTTAGVPTSGAGARERAALAARAGAAGTPRLLAESEHPPVVVMEHLDGSGSLADLLLGTQPGPAVDALLLWAEALAHLHAAGTPRTRSAFETELSDRAPDLAPRALTADFATAADRYSLVLSELGLARHGQAIEELRTLPELLSDDRDHVLSPADACPDNNIGTDDSVVLIDFEHAEIRHRAWDVAYLQAPWPSCWCAWLLPDEVSAAAVDRYCETAGLDPSDSRFRRDLAVATLGWRAMTPAWFLPGAMDSSDSHDPPWRPSRRAFVLHRLAAVSRTSLSPHLASMACDLHAELLDRWGDVTLQLAPAFRS